MADQITLDQWNRTLLARQHLLERVAEDAIEVLDRCVGLQAQDPKAPFYGLWSRIEGFEPAELDDLLTSREVVRMAVLRSTVFLMDSEDARWMRPVVQPATDSEMARHVRMLSTTTREAVLDDARELLTAEPHSSVALGRALAERHPGENPASLTLIARCGLALVQVPPRGLWRGSGMPTYRLFDDWAGEGEPAVVDDEARRDLIRLYLRGFGPASIKGIQTWCGLTRLRPLVQQMVDDWELMAMTGPDGVELFDLEGLDIIDGDIPAPVRLLAPYDNVLVAQADRRRITGEEQFRQVSTVNGQAPGYVLVDGRLAGSWRRDGEQVHVELMGEITRRGKRELDAEVQRLQDFCALP
ncbi:winged helix DNA-binding domain-containing protein [Gordonia sp. CPCC 206044]|uniref:winged helix DNA-binding domain-containing protein n=1 Tax=Gordonia sp. CPCC 206044 TaxID=3140793 RepID=UPI003AF362F1